MFSTKGSVNHRSKILSTILSSVKTSFFRSTEGYEANVNNSLSNMYCNI